MTVVGYQIGGADEGEEWTERKQKKTKKGLFLTQNGLKDENLYRYRIRMTNEVCWGEWSDVTDIRAGQIPSRPPTPRTKLAYKTLSDGKKELRVRVSWSKPIRASDYSKGFKILIGTKDPEVFKEDKASCDGEDAGIIASRKCYIPMSLFWGGDYRLDQGDLIRF